MKLKDNEVIYKSDYKQLGEEDRRHISMEELDERLKKELVGYNWKTAWLSNRLQEVKV